MIHDDISRFIGVYLLSISTATIMPSSQFAIEINTIFSMKMDLYICIFINQFVLLHVICSNYTTIIHFKSLDVSLIHPLIKDIHLSIYLFNSLIIYPYIHIITPILYIPSKLTFIIKITLPNLIY